MKDIFNELKKHKITLILKIIVIISFGVGIIYLNYEQIVQFISNMQKREIIGTIICLPGLVILFIFIVKEKIYSSINEVNDYYEVAKKAILNSTKVFINPKNAEADVNNEININSSDIMELMLLNMKEIKE